MIMCGGGAFAVVAIGQSAKGVGRDVVLCKVGLMPGPPVRKPDDIQWCGECGRYYNPKVPHECNGRVINEGRRALERWLGSYKIREEGN